MRGGVAAAHGSTREHHTALRACLDGRDGLPRDQVTEIQRSRLLAGALAAVAEEGYAGVMVAHITRHAQVSRRTFYELFENREACLAALVEEILALVEVPARRRPTCTGLGWRERVRGGLWSILTFFDREPALARMVVVEALRGGSQVQALRERALARLVETIDEGRERGSRAADCTALTAEGLVGAAFGIVHARVACEQRQPLRGLLGELMGMIVLPYCGPAAARAERARALPDAAAAPSPAPPALVLADRDPLRALPMRVTYRTARVLACIEREPGVSNRQVADAAGIRTRGRYRSCSRAWSTSTCCRTPARARARKARRTRGDYPARLAGRAASAGCRWLSE